MGEHDDVLEQLCDGRNLKSALLMILDALETGEMQKSFFIWHDINISDTLSSINEVMKSKYNIKVPDSEI